MAKTNAAHAATVLLERMHPRCVINFGVAGAYPRSGLAVGDVAIAEVEIYGDEGIEGPNGWISCEGIGIPLLERGANRYHNHFRLDGDIRRRAESALAAANLAHAVGPFVTVSACSGTVRRGEELAERHSAICETMEGAAVAHICAAYGVPFLEVRGVSNLVEDRDLSRWNLVSAANATADAVAVIGAAL
jgi:futalosine hydrolase